VECANGQTGFGRRRRDVTDKTPKNKVYEVSMSTVVRVGEDNDGNGDVAKAGRRQKETFVVEEGEFLRNVLSLCHATYRSLFSTIVLMGLRRDRFFRLH
jgi:hypothetical protein